jgi:GT2 family glycosyltransferase
MSHSGTGAVGLPLVYLVMVNWNGADDTLDCLQSCDGLDYGHLKVLVVDNGSTDDSLNVIRTGRPDIEILQLSRNGGFAAGCNAGIARALDAGADFVWLLNNDTIVRSTALSKLVEAATSDTKIGMAGSKILYADLPGTIWYAGGRITRLGRARHHLRGHSDRPGDREPRATSFITACSMLVRTETIRDIGPMPESYFMYWEDADWSCSATRRGWRLLYVPESVIWHKVGATASREATSSLRYQVRNRMHFHSRNKPCRTVLVGSAAIFQAIIYRLGGRANQSRAILQGLRDYREGLEGPL